MLVGIWGKPYIDLERYLDLGPLAAIHEEICLGLTRVPVDYTGGSHRTMGIMPPSRRDEAYADYGEVIRGMSHEEFLRFIALGDDSEAVDVERRHELEFGEEREISLSRRQMLFLKYRYKVYFPWKAYYELLPNRYWSEKSQAEGKAFTREARAIFPKTIAYIRALPFASIGRANILGLEANDHGTVHRDGDPAPDGPSLEPCHFITLCPAGDKRLFLWDEEQKRELMVEGRAYWFNDHDYHGVAPDPFFRYSIRIDGIFRRDFFEALRDDRPAHAVFGNGEAIERR